MNPRHALLPSAAVLAVGLFVPTGSAGAALVTRCEGVAADVSIPGDLIVPAGASCELTRTTIAGSVLVRSGADLVLLDASTVGGNVTVALDGFADVSDSSVAGSVIGRNPFSVIIDATEVGGDINVRNGGATVFDSTLYTVGALVEGSVAARGSEVFIESTDVGGGVTTSAGVLTDLLDSTVLGPLTVAGNELGSLVCESEIDGDASFTDNAYGLTIGGAGGFGDCAGASYWGGSVNISGNTGEVLGIDVSNNIVRGSLSGEGNDPAPTGSGNRVRGDVSGQFVDLQPAAPAPAVVARVAEAAGEEPAQEVLTEGGAPSGRVDPDGAMDARRAAAAEASAAAGAAFA